MIWDEWRLSELILIRLFICFCEFLFFPQNLPYPSSTCIKFSILFLQMCLRVYFSSHLKHNPKLLLVCMSNGVIVLNFNGLVWVFWLDSLFRIYYLNTTCDDWIEPQPKPTKITTINSQDEDNQLGFNNPSWNYIDWTKSNYNKEERMKEIIENWGRKKRYNWQFST